MEIEEDLKGQDRSHYGSDYQAHVLEIYKLYVEMTDSISARRQTANSFFLTLNTAVIGFDGYMFFSLDGVPFFWVLAVAGIVPIHL